MCFVFVVLSVFLLLDSRYQFTAVSAQTEKNAQDLNLAAKIRQLTNRSTDGLVEKKFANGTSGLDLQDRFQNVMLSKIDFKGDPVAACVTDLTEANAFFGRNLETGEPVSSGMYQRDGKAEIAADHGMSVDEFNFYKKLIEDAAIRRAENPQSATITIVNGDGTGEGFNDPTPATPEGSNNGATLGEQRLNLFNFAASIWGAYLDTSVPIAVNSQFNSLTPCTTNGGVLGSAGTTAIYRDFSRAQYPGTWYPVALANKRQGTDLNGATAEINTRFNTDVDASCLGAGSRFYYGLDNASLPGRINLLVVLLHEMGHGLGFISFASGTTGALNSGFPDVYTKFMYDATTGKNWLDMTDAERQASAINNNCVLGRSEFKNGIRFLDRRARFFGSREFIHAQHICQRFVGFSLRNNRVSESFDGAEHHFRLADKFGFNAPRNARHRLVSGHQRRFGSRHDNKRYAERQYDCYRNFGNDKLDQHRRF
ncbi:MAG: hypothetical protein ACR2HG_08820 [Pyrinomonadaceae bacterium]